MRPDYSIQQGKIKEKYLYRICGVRVLSEPTLTIELVTEPWQGKPSTKGAKQQLRS